MQQKVQFIGALLHEPELVVLDEPFSGLDPVNAKVMKDSRILKMMEDDTTPFDMRRMAYGGFRVLVDL